MEIERIPSADITRSCLIKNIGTFKKSWACPGIEPGTSRTLSENHTSRPTSLSLNFRRALTQLHKNALFTTAVAVYFYIHKAYKNRKF